MIKRFVLVGMVLALPALAPAAPVPYALTGGNYSEGFGGIASWASDFASGSGAAPWGSVAVNATGTIPDGKKTSVSTAAFASGSSGGVQKGTQNMVFLSVGSDNANACAVDLFLDFSTRTAGTLSFDWAEVDNSSGDRASSLKVYTSTNGTTFTELTAAMVTVTNHIAASGAKSALALPASFNGCATARIRFYSYTGSGGVTPTGSRPKISIDNLAVTSTGTGRPTVVVPPASRTNYVGDTATFHVTDLDADGYRWFNGATQYTNGGNVSGATSSTLSLSNLVELDATTNLTVVLSNAHGFETSAPPASLTVVPAPQTAIRYLNYNVDGNSIVGTDPTNWATTAPQVQAIGRQLVYLNPDIVAFNEIPIAYEYQMTNWVNAYLPGYYMASNSLGDGSIENFILSRFPIVNSASHLHASSLLPYGYTGSGFARDLFEAQISVPGISQPVHVFVAHLKATLGTPQDDADKRAAEAAAVSNYFVNVFLPSTNGSHLYLLSGDMNEDIIRPETGSYTTGEPIQKLTNGTGLFLTTPTNPATGSELTESIRGSLNVRFDYILPCGTLYSNIISSQVFRTDNLSPLPPGLNSGDSVASSDHLPVFMLFQNPYAATPPAIVTQPVSRTNDLGTTATFSVLAAGAAPLSYQWRKGGNALAEGGSYYGTTNSTLTISNVSQLDEAAYSVTVTNANGTTNSADATLTVVTPAETVTLWDFNSTSPDANTASGVTTPASGAGTAALVGGASSTFAAGASADPAASDNSGWNTATYATQATGNKSRGVKFAVSTASHRNILVSYYEQHSSTASRYMRFQYSTNGTDFIDGDVETFTTASTFQLQQHDLTGVAGVDNNPNFAFRVMAEFNSTAATNADANYISTGAGTSAAYGTGGTIRYDMVKIEGEPLVAPGVTTPDNVVTQEGNTVTFSVVATGTTPFTYQWFKGSTPLTDGGTVFGSSSATLELANVVVTDTGSYSVIVTNVVGAVTSSVASLTVTCPAITFSALPDGMDMTPYTNSVTASGGIPPYVYTLTSGSVPPGLSFVSGTLKGTPTTVGTNTFTIVATDANGCAGTNEYSVGVVAFVCPPITLSNVTNAYKLVKYLCPVTASPAGTYVFTNVSGALPPGLTLTNSTGKIGGKASVYGLYTFTLMASNTATGCTGTRTYSVYVNKTGAADTKQPVVTIKLPTPNAVVTNAVPVIVSGKVSDDVLVTNVEYNLDSTGWAVATAQSATNFSVSIGTLAPGLHTVQVRATDLSGNVDTLVNIKSVTFHYGTHSFVNQGGIYYGLFSESAGVATNSAGFAKIVVTAKEGKQPTFSATLWVDGKKHVKAGKFEMDGIGTFTSPIDRTVITAGPLTASLTLPLVDGATTLGGSILNQTTVQPGEPLWTADLTANQCLTNAGTVKVPIAGSTNWDGTYTVVVPSFGPEIGDGYSPLIITNGIVKLSAGKLADNQAFTLVTAPNLDAAGNWPVFVQSDKIAGRGQSILHGWISVAGGFTGSLKWIKGANQLTYPAGFNTNVTVEASTYGGDPGATLVLPLNNVSPTKAVGNVDLNNGGLTTNIVNSITLTNKGTANKFIDNLYTKLNHYYTLTLTLTPKTGALGGTFKNVGNGTLTAGKITGIVVTNQYVGRGFFIQTMPAPGTSSGRFLLTP